MKIDGINSCNARVDVINNNCRRDLIIKKIAFAIIVAINFAVVLGAFAYAVYKIDLPTKPLIVASFVLSIIGAGFAMMGKDFKVQGASVSSIAASVLNYIFFGPTVYLYNKIDWTAYHDPYVASTIYEEMRHFTFDEFQTSYGDRLSNLQKYGFIDQRTKEGLEPGVEKYRELKEELARLEKCIEPIKERINLKESPFFKRSEQLKAELEEFEQRWQHGKKKLFGEEETSTADKAKISSDA